MQNTPKWLPLGVAVVGVVLLGVLYYLIAIPDDSYSYIFNEANECVSTKNDLEDSLAKYKANLASMKEKKESLEKQLEEAQSNHLAAQHHLHTFREESAKQQKQCPICPSQSPFPDPDAWNKQRQVLWGHSDEKFPPCWKHTPLYIKGFNCGSCQKTTPADWPFEHDENVCNYISLGGCCKFRHLFGQSYDNSPQLGWGDLMHLDWAFSAHRHLRHIVELGTYKGLTSLHLAMMANLRNGSYVGFDVKDLRAKPIQDAWKRYPWMKLEVGDLISTTLPLQTAVDNISRKKTFVFYDNGNKVKEINDYAKHMHQDSAFCTHDWDIEISLPGIKKSLDDYQFEPFGFEHAEMLGSHVRCFTRSNSRKQFEPADPNILLQQNQD